MSDEINIILKIDDTQPKTEMQDFENKVDKVASKWQRVKRTIMQESTKVLHSIGSLIGLARAVVSSLNVSIGPMGEALLNIISSIISSAIAMQYAYAAAGPVGWVMMGIAAAALGVAIGTELKVMAGVAEAKGQSSDALRILSGLSSSLAPWGG